MKNKNIYTYLLIALCPTLTLSYFPEYRFGEYRFGGGYQLGQEFGPNNGILSSISAYTSDLYQNMTAPLFAKNISLPNFSDVFEYGNKAFDSAKNIPSDVIDRIKNLPENQQLALIGILSSVALYGTYHYHKTYIQPNKDLIRESVAFIENLYDNPAFLFQEALKNRSFPEIEKIIDQKQDMLMHALGLTESYLNMQSYIFSLREHRHTIFHLCNTLKNVIRSLKIDTVNKGFELSDELKNNIQTQCCTIYLYLMQALNVYEPETLDMLLRRVNRDNTYAPKNTFSYNKSSTLKAYCTIKNEIALLKEDRKKVVLSDITTLGKRIKYTEKDVLKDVYGNIIMRNLTSFLGFTHTEQQEIHDLFKLITNAYDDETIKKAEDMSTTVLGNIAHRLSVNEKWLLVEDYYKNKGIDIISSKPTSEDASSETLRGKFSIKFY